MTAEIEALTRALQNPARPFVAVVGGSKVSTKLTILAALADKVDQLIVGGSIANTFILAAGGRIGKSLAEPQLAGEARKIAIKLEAKGGVVPVPVDVVCAKELAASARAETKKATRDVADDDLILDIGPDTAQTLAGMLKQAGTIVWNGPVGVFEFDQFGAADHRQRDCGLESFFDRGWRRYYFAAVAKYDVGDRISAIFDERWSVPVGFSRRKKAPGNRNPLEQRKVEASGFRIQELNRHTKS